MPDKIPVTVVAPTVADLIKELKALRIPGGSFLVDRGMHGHATIMVYDKHGNRVADILNKE